MEYRNDLEAARLRINTLEAKLEESKASIEARDAELAEYRTERDRLRQTAGKNGPSSRRALYTVAAIAFVVGSILSFGAGALLLVKSSAPVATIATEEQPKVTITENGSTAEGATHTPPVGPAVPIATNAGNTNVRPDGPPEPIATSAGKTNDSATESITIESVVESLHPNIKACYRDEAKKNPKASGSLTVVFDIDPSGTLSRIKLETFPHVQPWWSKTFEACAVTAYRNATFPKTTAVKTTASGKYFLSALDLAF
jgi:hypothetical protein